MSRVNWCHSWECGYLSKIGKGGGTSMVLYQEAWKDFWDNSASEINPEEPSLPAQVFPNQVEKAQAFLPNLELCRELDLGFSPRGRCGSAGVSGEFCGNIDYLQVLEQPALVEADLWGLSNPKQCMFWDCMALSQPRAAPQSPVLSGGCSVQAPCCRLCSVQPNATTCGFVLVLAFSSAIIQIQLPLPLKSVPSC